MFRKQGDRNFCTPKRTQLSEFQEQQMGRIFEWGSLELGKRVSVKTRTSEDKVFYRGEISGSTRNGVIELFILTEIKSVLIETSHLK